MELNQRRTSLLLLLLFLVFKIVFQYTVVNPAYDLHRDEYLHLDMGYHLAAGYLSVPPFTAFNSLLVRWLGGGEFWVRFFPALYGALTMVVIWRMVCFLGGGLYAQALALTVFVCSAFSRLNVLYQPNSFDVLTWALICWLMMRYLQSQQGKWLLWTGVVAGIGLLNKYTVAVLLAGWLAALLLSSHRRIFRERDLYLGALIALVLAAPNLIWQVQQGFPVLHHMNELVATQLVHVDRMDFVTDQFIFFLGGAFLIVAAFAGLLFYWPYRLYRVVLLMYVLVILLLVYMRAKSYYALGLYPVLIAFGCAYWERVFRNGWNRYLRVLWLAVVVVPFVYLLNVVFPVLGPDQAREKGAKFAALGMLRWEDGKKHALPQDFADMLGWKEAAQLVMQAWQRIPEQARKNTLVICDNYGQAGAVNYFNRGRMPAAVSFSADYVYWFPKLDTLQYIVLLGNEPSEGYRPLIGRMEVVGTVQDALAREYGASVYLLSGLSPQVPVLLKKGVQEKQQSYHWKQGERR
ncbi:glycosyltransferase family 39 protein [Chitinophaga varians]|uniref:Glycosyltransferase family 39 protein n=1 Tax=Chitinophaga varians TaxID=2202339 RepID=A0A847RF51_9BACT|nr:glycosyltransferase family 39 protein [Chitinophaga varians]NLR64640.1 glycosyltransferase family 39 protein [Chitinophaga varians]